MDKKRIGIYYEASSSWIGGKYYLDSIINVLKENPDNEIIYLKRNFFSKVIGKVFGKHSKLYSFCFRFTDKKLDVVFPAVENSFKAKKIIYWIPDFQENYYPEFFSMNDICNRLIRYAYIAYSKDYLVLSSESAKKDFERLFPKYTCNVFVLPFVSSLVNYKNNTEVDVLKKYNINEPFFICSNQLWKHKNHELVVDAINELKQQNIHVLCLFTGKEEDFRNPDYPAMLKKKVKDLQLENEIKFLGFIPRNDQIELVKQSVAVIQPSLFEGWNTTIEDSKVLNKKILASSLPVHKEQLGEKGLFFDVEDSTKLAQLIKQTLNDGNEIIEYNYSNAVTEYKQKIKLLFE